MQYLQPEYFANKEDVCVILSRMNLSWLFAVWELPGFSPKIMAPAAQTSPVFWLPFFLARWLISGAA